MSERRIQVVAGHISPNNNNNNNNNKNNHVVKNTSTSGPTLTLACGCLSHYYCSTSTCCCSSLTFCCSSSTCCSASTDCRIKMESVNSSTVSDEVEGKSFEMMPSPPNQDQRLGHFKEISKAFFEGRRHELIRKWSLENGRIFRFISLDLEARKPKPIVVVADPVQAQRILRMNPTKEPLYSINMESLLGVGVLSNSDKQQWNYQRTNLKKAFTLDSASILLPVMKEGAQQIQSILKSKLNGKKH